MKDLNFAVTMNNLKMGMKKLPYITINRATGRMQHGNWQMVDGQVKLDIAKI